MHSPGEATAVARELLSTFPERKIWLIRGEMGAGKTTLIKAFCTELEVTDPTSSPTFAIVNEYHTSRRERIFHFDLYRLRSEQEALDLGFEEYLSSGSYCFIEWPEMAVRLLPGTAVNVQITTEGELRKVSAGVQD